MVLEKLRSSRLLPISFRVLSLAKVKERIKANRKNFLLEKRETSISHLLHHENDSTYEIRRDEMKREPSSSTPINLFLKLRTNSERNLTSGISTRVFVSYSPFFLSLVWNWKSIAGVWLSNSANNHHQLLRRKLVIRWRITSNNAVASNKKEADKWHKNIPRKQWENSPEFRFNLSKKAIAAAQL